MKDYVILDLETYNRLLRESDIYGRIDAFAQNNNMRAGTIVDAYRKLEREVRILRRSKESANK